MFKLDGKIAFITGAGSGIGAAIAETFAQAGAEVLIADRDCAAGESVTTKVKTAGARATFHQIDVSSESDCEKVAAQIPRVDILVNNAGIGHVGTILQTTAADLDRMYSVNIRGVFNLSKVFLPQMLERKSGCI